MKFERKHILIIGAGIHGVTIALELSKDHDVIMVDANEDILMGASNATHNRIHLGYHYPRSKNTIRECKSGYDLFLKEHQECLIFPDFYYVIEKQSKISAQQFRNTMIGENLPCDSIFPDTSFLNISHIQDSFKVKEACFDMMKLREKLKRQLVESGIKQYMNSNIEGVERDGKKLRLLNINTQKAPLELEVDLIVNCTYTYSNNLLKIFGIETNLTEYEFEETEIAVVESEMDIPAMTVMDGPFISILPYGNHKNKFLVYDVVHSVMSRENGLFFTKTEHGNRSNWSRMLEHGKKYYPFFDKLEYRYSLYSHRPIPKNNRGDSRTTRIIKENYDIDFFSIKEGKFISAPTVALQFKELVNRTL